MPPGIVTLSGSEEDRRLAEAAESSPSADSTVAYAKQGPGGVRAVSPPATGHSRHINLRA